VLSHEAMRRGGIVDDPPPTIAFHMSPAFAMPWNASRQKIPRIAIPLGGRESSNGRVETGCGLSQDVEGDEFLYLGAAITKRTASQFDQWRRHRRRARSVRVDSAADRSISPA